IEAAKRIDEKIEKGNAGPLAGVIVGIKNNIAYKGKLLTCGSAMLKGHRATYNATVVQRLLDADAVIIGSLNMDEFACGSDGTYSAIKITKNPFDLERVPGGSSSGSGAAVGAGFCDVALGSDTGGSVRCPAAFCNAYGLKPTYGIVSRYGLVDMAMSLDQIGIISREKELLKRVFRVISGKDANDQTTQLADERRVLEGKIERIGIPKEFFENVDGRIEKAVKRKIKELESRFEIVDVSIPTLHYTVPIYQLIMAAELSSALQKFDGLRYGYSADRNEELYSAFSNVRGSAFGKEIKRRVIIGTYITMKEFKDAWYTKALRAREQMKYEFEAILKKVDLLAGPAMPTPPWKFGEKMNPLEMYAADTLTIAANLTGLPAIVSPISESILDGALQLYGRHFEDELLIEIA
ncbi:MAG: aspartyl/glutamyl-tRNA amidotransferase subunit A, partial [Candidatus Micrarchaeota archaeon]|nr:aspartyl/glutamyl-tRNA amidotransferase subunit A [Candidatus Micrarchaeota archaeon]